MGFFPNQALDWERFGEPLEIKLVFRFKDVPDVCVILPSFQIDSLTTSVDAHVVVALLKSVKI